MTSVFIPFLILVIDWLEGLGESLSYVQIGLATVSEQAMGSFFFLVDLFVAVMLVIQAKGDNLSADELGATKAGLIECVKSSTNPEISSVYFQSHSGVSNKGSLASTTCHHYYI